MQLNQRKRRYEGVARVSTFTVGLLLIAHSLATAVLAGDLQVVPEISPGSISAGLGLLAGGVLILRARRRSK